MLFIIQCRGGSGNYHTRSPGEKRLLSIAVTRPTITSDGSLPSVTLHDDDASSPFHFAAHNDIPFLS